MSRRDTAEKKVKELTQREEGGVEKSYCCQAFLREQSREEFRRKQVK